MNFKRLVPYILAVLIIVIISFIYFFPVLEGKILEQSDITHHKGMSQELIDYREATGHEALWTNRMFSGMPGYMISTKYKGNVVNIIQSTINIIKRPVVFLFLYMLGFFILLRLLKIKHWLSLVGAIAFGFSSYFLIIINAGHNTKAYALGYMPLVVGGILYAFNEKRIIGAIIFTIALSLQIFVNHLQITYYTFLIVFIIGLFKLYAAIKDRKLPDFLKTISILLIGAIVAVGMNFSRLYTTWQYSKETIRGPSELTTNDENKTTGLDKDYVVQWSYGIDETLTLLIPNFMGGGSRINPGIDSESYRTMREKGVQNPRQTIQAVSMYHGDLPFTEGPVYVGAIIVFLFVLGLYTVKGSIKWWLLAATVVSIVLSWGGNIMWLTSFLLDHLPLYNKFRAPSMTLVIAEFTMPLLGIIAVNNILTGKTEKKQLFKGLKWSLIITGGLSLLFALLPGIAGDFTNNSDTMRFPEWLMESIVADREAMLRSDAFRSFLFIVLAAGTLYMWHIRKIKTTPVIVILGLLILIDLWTVDKRYLNNDNFVAKRKAENPFPMMPADKAILQDKDLSYRVLSLQGDAFQNARTSYYHKSIGGYHAAKLRRYQELIDHYLRPEMQQMVAGLQKNSPIDSVFRSLKAINMLNTRYIIYDLNQNPIRNPMALGNAWFVNGYKLVDNADAEIEALNNINPSSTAVVDNRFAEYVKGHTFNDDENGEIKLTGYEPNDLKYSYQAGSEQLVVFSEIYYDKGWNAYIDGNKAPHFRVDYVLRAMVIPAGNHEIEFKFEPKSYYIGNKISMASSILLILVIVGYGFYEFRKKRNKSNVTDEANK